MFTYMPKEHLREMQLIQLEMLCEVDRICKKNNIEYCIIAGTLLGAVRHGGYIPWDDDADVAMLRSEYNKFRTACKIDLDNNRFYFQDHKNTEGYRWGYGKIRRKNTEFIREGQEHMPYPSGVFIDIFPLDNVPDNIILRYVHNIICTLVRKTLWSKVGVKLERNYMKRQMFKILSRIPRKIVFGFYDVFKDIVNKKKSSMVRILTFPTPKNGYYGYYRKWYENLQSIEFEGYQFPGIRDYDEYLTFKFGDYQTLPPLHERKVHTASYYKLLQSKKNI